VGEKKNKNTFESKEKKVGKAKVSTVKEPSEKATTGGERREKN